MRPWIGVAVGAIAITSAAAAWPGIEALGLYYDEAFLAQQARDFVEPARATTHAASVRSVEVLGRPFPIRNAAYLGSLKSQLTIPAFWLFGATPGVLRGATFAVAWMAWAFTVAWAARVFSPAVAACAGVLLATDPAFAFFGRFEWGPFTTNWLCRAAALWLLAVAWQTRSERRRTFASLLAGVALGLGVYSRADFALIVAGFAGAAVLGHPRVVRETLRTHRGAVAAGLAGAVVASAPAWLSLPGLLGSGAAIADRGDLGFRLGVLWSVLDGSQFHRLMQTGGLFEAARQVAAPSGLLGVAALASFIGLAGAGVVRRRRDPEAGGRDPARWLWLATGLVTLATVLLPGAVRAHHQLNGLPLWHVLIAVALVRAAGIGRDTPAGWRTGLAAAALLVLVVSNWRVVVATEREILTTGGRGRWTHALGRLAARLDADPAARVVSLDWGFHEPLAFLTHRLPLDEPIWTIPRTLAAGRPWVYAGDADTRYLVHDAPYDLFGLGPRLLAAARAEQPGTVAIEPHADATGEVAFYSIRILRPHRLDFTGRFRIR